VQSIVRYEGEQNNVKDSIHAGWQSKLSDCHKERIAGLIEKNLEVKIEQITQPWGCRGSEYLIRN